MKRPTTMTGTGLSPASASSLTLAPAATVLHLPARVPLDAPTIPDDAVRPWEVVAAKLWLVAFVVAWFMTTPAAQ